MNCILPLSLHERLQAVFADALQIAAEQVTDGLAYRSIAEWNSVAHMALVAAIEDQFDIMIETDDVIDMSSFAKAKSIVGKYVAQ